MGNITHLLTNEFAKTQELKKPRRRFKAIAKLFKLDRDKEEANGEKLKKIIRSLEPKIFIFSFEILVSATRNFNSNSKMGSGGFGIVYKGTLGDGRKIAVKRLSDSSMQGKKEFINEIILLPRVQHRNVVNFLGYCIHGVDKLLVYKYFQNRSLDKYLFGNSKRGELDWKRRYDVIVGVARGLHFLHEDSPNRIIHRDIKPDNILLDDNWVPKIADFGIAYLFPYDDDTCVDHSFGSMASDEHTSVTTDVMGTSGYAAPEYMMTGRLSKKVDIYSFGIVVLEIISGQMNHGFLRDHQIQDDLIGWTRKLYKEGRSLDIMDSTLAPEIDTDQIAKCIQIGLLCTEFDPIMRPTMLDVLMMLSKKSGTIEEPTSPGRDSLLSIPFYNTLRE